MNKFIEHRPDNCPDQPRFKGGILVIAIAAFLLWCGIFLLWWTAGHS
jgi:hypothetical protein